MCHNIVKAVPLTRKCPQTIYFREGSWISAKRCAIKHNESRGADPAPATALTSNSFCHPTFVSFMVSGAISRWKCELWKRNENGVSQTALLRDSEMTTAIKIGITTKFVCLQYEFLEGGGGKLVLMKLLFKPRQNYLDCHPVWCGPS